MAEERYGTQQRRPILEAKAREDAAWDANVGVVTAIEPVNAIAGPDIGHRGVS